MKKITINALPPSDSPCYSHLQPIADFLIAKGNTSANSYLWGSNRTGYFCYLRKKIDFQSIRENFDLPATVKIDEQRQTIDCLLTYSLIGEVSVE